MARVLGIDCGRVIFYPLGKQVPGSLESLRKIVESGTFERIFIVSRANTLNRLYFPFRLARLDFWNRTGIPKNAIRFCWRNEDKAALCRDLGVTDFIDDRLDVLRHLDTVKRRYALDPNKKELALYPETARGVIIARTWKELLPRILG